MVWNVVAVVVAVLGTFVVAWQAYETHRTTTLSQRTLASSHSLAIDSARTRLDQGAPRIDVFVEQVAVLAGDLGEPGAGGASATWHLPADAGRVLRVQAKVTVASLMERRTIHMKVSGLDRPAGSAGTGALLDPSVRLTFLLTASFTLGQWAENWEAHQAGETEPHIAGGQVTASDDRDEGVEDTWPVRLAAWPIEPAGDKTGTDNTGTWALTGAGSGETWVRIAIRPLRERTYWISQSKKIPLPEPSYDQP